MNEFSERLWLLTRWAVLLLVIGSVALGALLLFDGDGAGSMFLLIAVGAAVFFWLLQWLITGNTTLTYLLPWQSKYSTEDKWPCPMKLEQKRN